MNYVFPSSKIWRPFCQFWPSLILRKKQVTVRSTQIFIQIPHKSMSRREEPWHWCRWRGQVPLGPWGDVHSHQLADITPFQQFCWVRTLRFNSFKSGWWMFKGDWLWGVVCISLTKQVCELSMSYRTLAPPKEKNQATSRWIMPNQPTPPTYTPRNKGLIRPYEEKPILVKPLLRPYWLISHDS